MDLETYQKLVVALHEASQGVDDHWAQILETQMMAGGVVGQAGSKPLDQAWLDEHEPLKVARESAEMALVDYLRQH